MASCGFEKLEVYKLSETLADDVWRLVQSWPRLAQDTVGKQLIRACDSIGANIAEGSGKGTYADNRRYVRVARGSMYETRHWLRRAFRRQLLSPTETERLDSWWKNSVHASMHTSTPSAAIHLLKVQIKRAMQVTSDK